MTGEWNIVYGTDFLSIGDAEYVGCCVHLLCLEGSGRLVFNNIPIKVHANDSLIFSNAELVSDIVAGEDLRVEYIVIRTSFINRILPANRYGIGGRISLFGDPVISLTEEEAGKLHEDMQHLRSRLSDTGHAFYDNLVGGLAQAMIYDLYDFHFKQNMSIDATGSASIVVKGFMDLLNAGLCKSHRDVKFYAEELHVTPKYLSDTVKRLTGQTVTQMITAYTLPFVTGMLKDNKLSIVQIADALNFASVSYFCRYVQKHLGMPPGDYRKSTMPVKAKKS